MMFSEELDVSRVFSVKTKEELFTHEKMWAVCTAIVSGDYEDFFDTKLKGSLQKTLLFDFIDPDKVVPESTTKYIEIWHKDGNIKRASSTTEIPYVYLGKPQEFSQLKVELGFRDNIIARLEEMFFLISPTDVFIDKVYFNSDGSYAGISVSPTIIKDTFLSGSPLRNLLTKLDEKKQKYDFDLTDDKIIVKPIKYYGNYNYAFPIDVREERALDYKKLSYTKKKVIKEQVVNRYVEIIRDDYELFDDYQAQFVSMLFDHENQELDINVHFNLDGSLDDVLVYKREAKDFKVWRS